MKCLNIKLFRVILFVIIIILLLFLLFFKFSNSEQVNLFDVMLGDENDSEIPFYIYIYLSRESCFSCLDGIEKLNLIVNLKKKIVLPKSDSDLIKVYSERFKIEAIIENEELHRIRPEMNPSIIGISKNNRILFVLPLLQGSENYINDIIFGLFQKLN